MLKPKIQQPAAVNHRAAGYFKMLGKDFSVNRYIYLMAFPVILYYILFHYMPMYGVVIAFKQFEVTKGIMGSAWVGFDHFTRFFNSINFMRVVPNTLILSLTMLIFNFPAPLLLALLLNEVKNMRLKRTVQTISYMPHFISVIVICGMIVQFTSKDGLITDILVAMGFVRENLLLNQSMFRPIYIISGIWQEIGWGSIIYLSALSAIDQELYEAVKIDGAGRWKQLLHVTLPGIKTTVIILLILRIGQIMNVGFEKVLLLYNKNTYDTADIISTYVYRMGIQNNSYDYSTAIGLFNSLINLTLLYVANALSKKVSEVSLW